MNFVSFPARYVPKTITKNDTKRQVGMLLKSRKLYKQHRYYDRKKVKSYKSVKSAHVIKARAVYRIANVEPNRELAAKTGCKMSALKEIVKKGEGAYYSSGSRPNQTARSWGLARLASAVTAGKAAAVDYTILEKGCDPNKKALKLAKQSKLRYKHGQSRTKTRKWRK
jgi:hypothetical protein